jgi:hypothetical protein
LAFQANEFRRGGGGGTDDVGGRLDLGAQGELFELCRVQFADEVSAVDEIDPALCAFSRAKYF